jgi:hypothetical protein
MPEDIGLEPEGVPLERRHLGIRDQRNKSRRLIARRPVFAVPQLVRPRMAENTEDRPVYARTS